jgi:copper transport protein
MRVGVLRKATTAALLVVLIFLALGVKTPNAGAHAVLELSKPAAGESLAQPPNEVILYFTEAIEIDYSSAYVVDTDKKRWELPNEGTFHIHGDPTNPGLIMQPNMPNGTYTVVWDVLSAVDGHRTKGAFAFFVGPPPIEPLGPTAPADIGSVSAPPESLEVFVRWANFIAMAALIGAAVSPFILLPAGVSRLKPSPANDDGVKRALRIARISTLVAAIALVLASCAGLWVQVWLASGDSTPFGDFRDFVSGTRYGDIWVARMALAAGAVVCSLLIMARARGDWHESILHPKNTPWAILAALSLAIPVTTSLNSHAAGGGDFNFQTAIDYAHLVSGGLWIGLLLQFVLLLVIVVPRLEERAGFLAGMVRRFSWVAVPTVVVIVTTGVIQSIDRLGGIDELFDTSYGLTLALKIVLLAPILVIGAVNLLIFGPRFLEFARHKARALLEMRPWEGAFRYALILEISLAFVVLAATALLTNTSPPGSAQGGDSSVSQPTNAAPTPSADSGFALVEDVTLSVWAEPAKAGFNDVNVLVIDQEGDE